MSTAITIPNGTNGTVSRYNEADIKTEVSILRQAFPKLNAPDDALRALIIASKMSGLNPFRGEIYYIPGVGISVSSKIKASDAVAYQARFGNTLEIKFERVTSAMTEYPVYSRFAGNIDDNDVNFSCRIISSKQRTAYHQHRIMLARELREYGYIGRELETEVNNRAGDPPEIIAIGIVRKGENFGGDQKYSRADRAMKRALQLALNAGGFAAPDMRNYGGISITNEAEPSQEAIEGTYRTVSPDQLIPQKGGVQMPDDIQWDIPEQNDEAVIEAPVQQTAAPRSNPLVQNIRIAAAKHVGKKASDGMKGIIANALEADFPGKRHAANKALCGVESMKEMTDDQIFALNEVLQPYKNGDGKYHINAQIKPQIAELLTA